MSTLEGVKAGIEGMTGDIVPRGLDGISPQVEVTENEGGYHVKITDKEGVHELDLMHGTDGKDGIDGKDGTDGKDGYTPVKGVDYFDGVNGKDGKDGESIKGDPGEDGIDGKDGRTPNIWLAPGWNSADGRQDYIPMSDLVGTAVPSVETVQEGDLIICGQDGGILFVNVASDAIAGGAVSATAGTNVPDNWQDGSAVKILGADGKDGSDGKDGVSPNLSIGTVTTLAAGSNAAAEIVGQSPNLTLNLGIPKGADGAGGGTSADWSVNNENATGYVKNRTHWKADRYSTATRTAVNESAAEFIASGMTTPDGTELYVCELEGNEFPAQGELVFTTFDGFRLDREVKTVGFNGRTFLGFGNLSLLDAQEQDTGDQWVIIYDAASGGYSVATTETGENHSIKIAWDYRYYDVVPVNASYPLGGNYIHSWEMEKGGLTPGATYKIEFTRDYSEGESTGYGSANVTGYAVIEEDLKGTGVPGGEFIAAFTHSGSGDLISEGHCIGDITLNESGRVLVQIDFEAAGVPGSDKKVMLLRIRTEDDPAQLHEWHTLAEGYLPETVKKLIRNGSGSGGMGGADWNAAEGEPGHVLNRTHWVEGGSLSDTLEWDGDLTGKIKVVISAADESGIEQGIVNLSSAVLTLEQLEGATMVYTTEDESNEIVEKTVVLSADTNMIDGFEQIGTPCVLIITDDDYVAYLMPSDTDIDGLTIPKGMNFLYVAEDGAAFIRLVSLKCLTSCISGDEIVHKLDSKFLPDDIGGNSDIVVVEITQTGPMDFEASMSASEIMAEVQNGKIVFASVSGILVSLIDVGDDYVRFQRTVVSEDALIAEGIKVREDKTIMLSQNTYTLTPAT